AAAQIEPERNLLVRDPLRQVGELPGGKQVRQAQQDAQRARRADQQHLPAGEVEHRLCFSGEAHTLSTSRRAGSFSLADSRSLSRAASRAAVGSGLASTEVIVLRSTRTRTLEAMSTSTSSGFTTRFTVPRMPPPVTTRSPRRSASIIAR